MSSIMASAAVSSLSFGGVRSCIRSSTVLQRTIYNRATLTRAVSSASRLNDHHESMVSYTTSSILPRGIHWRSPKISCPSSSMCCVSCSRHFSTAKGDPSGDSGSSQSQSPPGSLSDLSEEELQAHLKDVGKKELKSEFQKADISGDGQLSLEEFELWAQSIMAGAETEDAGPPTRQQLHRVFLRQLPPFLGFGLVDNSLMIISGDMIDSTFGFYLGISTMAAAALGNAFSNGVGMFLHGLIERIGNNLGLPDPALSLAQLKDHNTQLWKTGGSVAGILAGCLLGMWPLLFMDAKRSGEQ